MQVEYKNIDAKLVVNEIRNGRSLESVQKLFGIKFKSEVQDLYLRGLMELGEIPRVDFKRPASSPKLPTTPTTPTAPPSAVERDRTVIRRRERIIQPVASSAPARVSAPAVAPLPAAPAPAAPAKPALIIKTDNFRTIGQSGSITLNKALLIEQLGFVVGDSFEIFREDDRIVLLKTATPH